MMQFWNLVAIVLWTPQLWPEFEVHSRSVCLQLDFHLRQQLRHHVPQVDPAPPHLCVCSSVGLSRKDRTDCAARRNYGKRRTELSVEFVFYTEMNLWTYSGRFVMEHTTVYFVSSISPAFACTVPDLCVNLPFRCSTGVYSRFINAESQWSHQCAWLLRRVRFRHRPSGVSRHGAGERRLQGTSGSGEMCRVVWICGV